MQNRVLYTTSNDDIIESIVDIVKCKKELINDYIRSSNINHNTIIDNINLELFFKKIGLDFNGKNELYELIKFDSIIISHLTSRLETPKDKPILNLLDTLTSDTDLSSFLKFKGLIFKEEKNQLNTYYNGNIVNWDLYSNSYASRIKVRFRKKGKYIDNCINGFLFNYFFWKDSDVEHIIKCPEILHDICSVLKREDIIDEWRKSVKTYALGFEASVKDIIIDERCRLKTKRSKIYYIYKQVIYFLCLDYKNLWEDRWDNPIIRLKDNLSLPSANFFGYYEVE